MRYGETGVLVHDKAKATPGHTVFSGLRGTMVYVIDLEGEVVHRWELPQSVSGHLEVLDDGHLLIAHRTQEGPPILGTLEGTARGAYWALDKALRAAWDVLTFLAPHYNGAPPTHELEW